MKTRYAICTSALVAAVGFATRGMAAPPSTTVAPNSLSNTKWELVIPDWKLSANARVKAPVLEFTKDRLSATVGCNRMGGSYTLKGTAIKVGPMISTKMSCGPELDRLEGEYGQAIQVATGWQLSRDGQTLLLQGDKKSYVFKRTRVGVK